MHWQTKQQLQRLFGATSHTVNLYYFLTTKALGSRSGEPRKWCFWFREHALLIRRWTKRPSLRGTVWCIDPGFTHTATMLLRLAADRVLVTSRFPWMANRYLDAAADRIRSELSLFARVLGLPEGDCAGRLDEACQGLKAGGPTWLTASFGAAAPRLNGQPDKSVDDIVSMGAMEHYDPAAVAVAFGEMYRVLRPGGAMSHIIDLRDHFHHADARLHPLNHLRYARQDWGRKTSPLSYTNQLRRSDYVRLVEAAGFRIVYKGFDPHGDYPPLGSLIHPDHASDDPLDDDARVMHVIGVKPQAG